MKKHRIKRVIEFLHDHKWNSLVTVGVFIVLVVAFFSAYCHFGFAVAKDEIVFGRALSRSQNTFLGTNAVRDIDEASGIVGSADTAITDNVSSKKVASPNRTGFYGGSRTSQVTHLPSGLEATNESDHVLLSLPWVSGVDDAGQRVSVYRRSTPRGFTRINAYPLSANEYKDYLANNLSGAIDYFAILLDANGNALAQSNIATVVRNKLLTLSEL